MSRRRTGGRRGSNRLLHGISRIEREKRYEDMSDEEVAARLAVVLNEVTA